MPAGVEIFIPSRLSRTAILKQAFLGQPYFVPPPKNTITTSQKHLLRRLFVNRLVGQSYSSFGVNAFRNVEPVGLRRDARVCILSIAPCAVSAYRSGTRY